MPVAVSVVDTSVKVSQLPVGATSTDPSSVPVAEPLRISTVPPAPADETSAVKVVAPAVSTWEYPAQSPFSIWPRVCPPLAEPWFARSTPEPEVYDSPSTVPVPGPGFPPSSGEQSASTAPAAYWMPPSRT